MGQSRATNQWVQHSGTTCRWKFIESVVVSTVHSWATSRSQSVFYAFLGQKMRIPMPLWCGGTCYKHVHPNEGGRKERQNLVWTCLGYLQKPSWGDAAPFPQESQRSPVQHHKVKCTDAWRNVRKKSSLAWCCGDPQASPKTMHPIQACFQTSSSQKLANTATENKNHKKRPAGNWPQQRTSSQKCIAKARGCRYLDGMWNVKKWQTVRAEVHPVVLSPTLPYVAPHS